MITTFAEKLRIRFQQPLPGEKAQLAMAPEARRRITTADYKATNARKSAVLIIMFPENNKVHTLLIQRPVYEGVHSGQVAFPGGKFEESDESLEYTALREANEEVGIVPQQVTIIGKLTDLYIPPSNFLVSPYIGYVSEKPDFIADAREVDRIIAIELSALNAPEIIKEKVITHSGGYTIKTPCYELQGLTIWGATAMMISELNVVVGEVSV